jgi:hypothetical protein
MKRELKLTDEFFFGVRDEQTGKIVARSRDGWRATDKAKALNRKGNCWEKQSEPDSMGRPVWSKALGNRYVVVMKQD